MRRRCRVGAGEAAVAAVVGVERLRARRGRRKDARAVPDGSRRRHRSCTCPSRTRAPNPSGRPHPDRSPHVHRNRVVLADDRRRRRRAGDRRRRVRPRRTDCVPASTRARRPVTRAAGELRGDRVVADDPTPTWRTTRPEPSTSTVRRECGPTVKNTTDPVGVAATEPPTTPSPRTSRSHRTPTTVVRRHHTSSSPPPSPSE